MEYRHDLLFNGEGTQKFNNGTIFRGTIREGIPQAIAPFKFMYPYGEVYS